MMEPRLTERMCFQSVLQQHSWMMLSLLDSMGDGLVVTNADGQFVFFNEAAKQQFGFLPTTEMAIEWMEHSPCYRSDGVTPFPIAERPLTRALRGEAVDSVELLVRRAQVPAELCLSVTARPLMDEAGKVSGAVAVYRDVTERTHAEQELKSALAQSRALSAHLQSVREEERSHIAREIHDELGQVLTGLKMDLAWLKCRLAEERQETSRALLLNKVQDMSRLIDTTIQAVRQLATELRPGILDHLGLSAAIEWQAEEFEKHSGIRCRVISTLADVPLDKEQTTAAFRILQESLTNVARHAEAVTAVTILLTQEADFLVLEIEDNGHGFHKDDLASKHTLGLLGMRERAAILGGEVQITSKLGQGTKVTARIPLEPRPDTD